MLLIAATSEGIFFFDASPLPLLGRGHGLIKDSARWKQKEAGKNQMADRRTVQQALPSLLSEQMPVEQELARERKDYRELGIN